VVTKQELLLAKALKQLEKESLNVCFDPYEPNSRPTKSQEEFFKGAAKSQYRIIRAGNQSGKTMCGAREVAWVLNGNHPYWKRKKELANRPLKVLICTISSNMVEEIWYKKLKPFLGPDWKDKKSSGALKGGKNAKGDEVTFLIHGDGSQKLLNNMQGFVADYVWLDEMPLKAKVFEELQRRVDRTGGPFIATFTPKSVNPQIRKTIEQAEAVDNGLTKIYYLSKLDNPSLDKEATLAQIAHLSDAERRTILYGDWSVGESNVFKVDYEKMIKPLPQHYSKKGWRHVESVDPGSATTGLTVWAEDPQTGNWWCVLARYIEGERDPVKTYDLVQSITKEYNIMRRICDPASSWYMGHAVSRGTIPPYIYPWGKTHGRKLELIKQLQQKLGEGQLILADGLSGLLIEELSNAMWNSTGESIVNRNSYHCCDSAQYFADLIPEREINHPGRHPHEILRELDDQRRFAAYEKEQKANTVSKLRRGRAWRR